jgi:Transposase
MGRRKFSREFKVSALRLVGEQGHSVAEAARNLGVTSRHSGKTLSFPSDSPNPPPLGWPVPGGY